jgi:hypothetical protein
MRRLGMGTLKMGIMCLLLFGLTLGLVLTPEIAQSLNESEISNENTRSVINPEIWYIYSLKELTENVTFELPIVINSSGELRIKNRATIELLQKFDFQRNITIKDNGTLRIKKSTLFSNRALYIKLMDTGKLIIEKGGEFKVTKVSAKGNSVIKIQGGKLSPGSGDLDIDLIDDATLNLDSGIIDNADRFSAMDNTKLELNNCSFTSKEYDISCAELKIASNAVITDLKIDSCKNINIYNSRLTGFEISSCENLNSYSSSEIINMNIESLGVATLTSSEIQNLRIDYVNDLSLQSCEVNILKIKEKVTNLNIQNSDISQLDIEECKKLETYNTYFDNSELKSSTDQVVFHSSTIEHCTIFPLKLEIYNSEIIGNKDELNDLTRGQHLMAYNSSFNAPLHFTGTSQADLVNCSTLGTIPPKVIVDSDAQVNLYWWLDVQVLDNESKPLPNVLVTVHDFITNTKIKEGVSAEFGRVKFALLANTITKHGWNTKNNKSYFIRGNYDTLLKENGTGIWMKDNTNSILDFSEVKEESVKEETFFTPETITGILIFIIIVILIIFSLVSGRKSKNGKGKAGSGSGRTNGDRNGGYNGGIPRRNGIGNGNGNGRSKGRNYPRGRPPRRGNGGRKPTVTVFKELK